MLLLVNLGMFGSVSPIGDIYLGRGKLNVDVASPQVPELSDLLSVSCVDK